MMFTVLFLQLRVRVRHPKVDTYIRLLICPPTWTPTIGDCFSCSVHSSLIFLTSSWASSDLESTSGAARSASCSVHKPRQCGARVSDLLYPHLQHHHHHLHYSPPNALCFAIGDVTAAQGCFLWSWGSKQLIQGKSQSVPESWPSLLRQNTSSGPGSTGWRRWCGNNNTASLNLHHRRGLVFQRQKDEGVRGCRWNSAATLRHSLIPNHLLRGGFRSFPTVRTHASASCRKLNSPLLDLLDFKTMKNWRETKD